MIKLLEDVDVDVEGVTFNSEGGPKALYVWADDFGGGTVSIESSADNITFIALQENGVDIAITEDSINIIDYLAQGVKVRAILSGSTSPVDLNAWLA